MNIDYHYYQGFTNRPMDQNLNVMGIKTIKCHVMSSKQIFAIYPRLN